MTAGAVGSPLVLIRRGGGQSLEASHLAQRGYPLPRCERHIPAGAVALAEAALDAAVHQLVGGGRLLQMLQVQLRILQAWPVSVSWGSTCGGMAEAVVAASSACTGPVYANSKSSRQCMQPYD